MAPKPAMRLRVRGSVLVTAMFSAAVALSPATAAGDWPMSRHDPQRTGASPGSSNISTPVPFWRTYLGGHLNPDELIAYDVDGDHAPDYLYLEGGKLIARRAAGDLIWTTPTMGLVHF